MISEDMARRLAEAFCRTPLPETFNPDAGISFAKPISGPWPTGTNLFTVAEATEMFKGMDADLVENEKFVINNIVSWIHNLNVTAGWWSDKLTGESTLETRNVGEILMLIVSEIAEGMEGHRKGLMDDKLPHRPMLEVELADAVIRIFDLAGAKGFDLGGAIFEKVAYNQTREDHKLENRLKPGGKAY